MKLVPLQNRGWPVLGTSIAIIRLRDKRGFAVGVQEPMRSGGVGRVWCRLSDARHRATKLAAIHHAPIVEAL